MLVTFDFYGMSMGSHICLVTNILQNIELSETEYH